MAQFDSDKLAIEQSELSHRVPMLVSSAEFIPILIFLCLADLCCMCLR